MNKSLSNYVVKYESAIPKELCDLTIKKLQNVEWSSKLNFDYPNKEFDLRYDENDIKINFKTYQTEIINGGVQRENHLTKPFEEIIYDCLDSYIFLDNDFDSYKKWYNFTQARFNKYEKDMYMKKHCDHIRTMFDGVWKGIPIYSVIGILNSDFEGGQLIFWEDEEIKLNVGDIVVFPSNFLYPHRVERIRSGIRYSFSSYAF